MDRGALEDCLSTLIVSGNGGASTPTVNMGNGQGNTDQDSPDGLSDVDKTGSGDNGIGNSLDVQRNAAGFQVPLRCDGAALSGSCSSSASIAGTTSKTRKKNNFGVIGSAEFKSEVTPVEAKQAGLTIFDGLRNGLTKVFINEITDKRFGSGTNKKGQYISVVSWNGTQDALVQTSALGRNKGAY